MEPSRQEFSDQLLLTYEKTCVHACLLEYLICLFSVHTQPMLTSPSVDTKMIFAPAHVGDKCRGVSRDGCRKWGRIALCSEERQRLQEGLEFDVARRRRRTPERRRHRSEVFYSCCPIRGAIDACFLRLNP
jgi:hypothetical protein